MKIRKLLKHETPPFELLLLADPSRELVEQYIAMGSAVLLKKKAKSLVSMCLSS